MGHLDECKAIGTHWISLYVNRDNVTYFDNFGVEYIPKKIKTFIGKKILQQIFMEYMQIIQYCVDTFVLHLLILC